VALTDPLEQAPDLELAKLAQQTNEKAFAEIVRRYSPRVFQVAGRFFRERSLVEDASQETFLRAYTHIADYEGRGSLEGWITRIATTTCLNLLRNSQRRPEAEATALTERETAWLDNHLANVSAERHRATENSREVADLADRVLGTLSAEDRLVLMLVDGEEMSIKEVADTTGWSQSKVKVQTFRARRRMRKAVENVLAGRKQNPSKEPTNEVAG
jgi:RNA polymerase sigma-70 factor, ECF subfamily